ncbi:MAG: NAD(P)/FAD-dependent oxidoreductase [Fimbriimonadaceae bacterium]|nr:NAD(P)/FAD-dependent oxidoreductase [Chitinophagales bacterium]
MQKMLAIIGGGAAGFFAAINAAELNPQLQVHVFEKGNAFLQKVKISGGGRCNITHACFDPQELIKFYPRGSKELLGPLYIFNPDHTIDWFRKRGIKIVKEDDGRMFPSTNTSQTITDCFLQETEKNNIHLHLQKGVQQIEKLDSGKWKLILSDKKEFVCDHLLITSGSSNQIWNMLKQLGHTIESPVASLFTFNIKDARIKDLMGVSVANAFCSIVNTKLNTAGPLLITHWGLSGPSILKLSAWAARELAAMHYQFQLKINFITESNYQSCLEILSANKKSSPKKTVQLTNNFNLPSRLYKSLCDHAEISATLNWSDISKEKIQLLAKNLTESIFDVNGKSNFKDEFVTCGGIKLYEVDFKTMQSKIHNNLFFAGEVLNIDAVTGGFNFQSAWTTGFIAATAIAEK